MSCTEVLVGSHDARQNLSTHDQRVRQRLKVPHAHVTGTTTFTSPGLPEKYSDPSKSGFSETVHATASKNVYDSRLPRWGLAF